MTAVEPAVRDEDAAVSSLAPPPPLRSAAERTAAALAGAAEWPQAARAAVLADLDASITTLTAARAELLVVERAAGAWRASGDPSFEAWRGRTSRMGSRAAATEVRRAETLAEMPSLRSAARAGQVSIEHVDVVARTQATASPLVRTALTSPEGESELLELARRVDAGRFAKAVAVLAASIDHDALERSHQAQRAERFLTLADTPRGTRLSGLLDAMTGHRLRLALEAVTGKPAPDDPRTPEQRRADALDTIAGAALAAPPQPDGTGRRPHVSLVLNVETWAALRGRRGKQSSTPAVPEPPTPRLAPAVLEGGTPVPGSEVARILCDCELTRIVVDERSEPVDLGRSARTHTPAQRRAVTVRDGGCLWPDCGSPARWCQVHHLVWWDRDNGPTTVLDGALACSFHHHEIHRLDLTVTRYAVPPSTYEPGGSTTRYVIESPDGTVIADGRPISGDARLGTPVRRWVPGTGVVAARREVRAGLAPPRRSADAEETTGGPCPRGRPPARATSAGSAPTARAG